MRVEISEVVQQVSGQAVAGASVQVNVRDGAAATVYAAATGVTTTTNPLTSDSRGRIEGWLEESSYDLVVTALGQTYTQRFEAVAAAMQLETFGALVKGGQYFGPAAGNFATTLGGEGTLRLQALWVPRTSTVDRIACDCLTLGTAGALFRLGIYNDNAGAPGSLLLDAGTVDVTSTGFKAITISQALVAGRYWVGGAWQGGAGTRGTLKDLRGAVASAPHPGTTGAASCIYEVASGVTGALPDPAGTSLSGSSAPWILLRAA